MKNQVHAAAFKAAKAMTQNPDEFSWRAKVIHHRYAALVEAADDAQDFLSAIADATKGAGRIDENSILRFGERLKTTARKLDKKLRAELARVKGAQGAT